jgi:hypothetical protein
MKFVSRLAVGAVLAVGMAGGALFAAEEGITALPTLLIKGEVVSVDASDPAAKLLTVKDRYGFETPIFLTQDAQISKGEEPFDLANLATGTAIEVEYNFDINTAKRHAVSVKVAMPAAVAPPTPAAPAMPEVTPMVDVAAPVEPAALAEPVTDPSTSTGESAAPSVE